MFSKIDMKQKLQIRTNSLSNLEKLPNNSRNRLLSNMNTLEIKILEE